jgi:AcrR family transcriptional regulator
VNNGSVPDKTQRRTRHPERTRAAIFDAAADLFAERGYEGTSIRAVAERAGVTHGTLYLYFRDKDDLLYQLAEEQARALLVRLRSLPRTLDPVTRIREAFRTVVRFGVESPNHYHTIFSSRVSQSSATDTVVPLTPPAQEVYAFLHDTLDHAARRSLIASDDTARDAWSFLATAHGIIEFRRTHVAAPESALSQAERVMELLLRGIEPVRSSRDSPSGS